MFITVFSCKCLLKYSVLTVIIYSISYVCFAYVRYEMLQETVLAYRREISALQDRNQKMAATAQRHEHVILKMTQDLQQANEKLALNEVQ